MNKEREIIEFFAKCKENKQKIIQEKNEIINKLLLLKKNKVSKEKYLSLRNEWNNRREETPDEKNRRECEEMLDEINEKIEYLNNKQKEFEQIQIEQIEFDKKIDELRKERELFSVKNEFKELVNEYVPASVFNNLVNNFNVLIDQHNKYTIL